MMMMMMMMMMMNLSYARAMQAAIVLIGT